LDNALGLLGPFNIFHLWSLSIEEQFYLIWPWLVRRVLSKRMLRVICVVGIVTALLLRLALLQTKISPWWLYTSLPTRMDALLAGALLALIPLPPLRMAGTAAVGAGGVFVASAVAHHSVFFLSPSIAGVGYTAAVILATSLLVMSLYPATLVSRVCTWKVLRFYGRYSYGLYLWHYLFSQQFGGMRKWVSARVPHVLPAAVMSFLLILACSTMFAFASYWMIEQPFLKLKRRYGSERQPKAGRNFDVGKPWSLSWRQRQASTE